MMFEGPVRLLVALIISSVFIWDGANLERSFTFAAEPLELLDEEVLDTIKIEESVHFTTPQAGDILVLAGTYRVTAAAEDRIRLIPRKVSAPLEIASLNSNHTEELSEPVALYVRDDEKFPHVLLLLPDGRTLEAVGSYDIVRSRGFEEVLRLTAIQIQKALSKKRRSKSTNTH